MTAQERKPAFRLLFLIATPKLVEKAIDLYTEGHIPVQYLFRAQGTASSEIMDLLGLGGVEKDVSVSIMPKFFADRMLTKLQKQLHLGMPNSGVAFTVSLSGGSAHMVRLMEPLLSNEEQGAQGKEEAEMTEQAYSLIIAIVDQGFSEEVMEAARPKGATGGTVFHSRRVGSEEAMRFWGIRVQPEREVVMILANKEEKTEIMQAIGKACGMQSEAHGVLLSLPVDGVVGLNG